MSSIRLSSKHGVNPSVMHCFFCQEASGVALMGMLPDDKEAPRQCMLDMVPCSECKGYMEQGVIIIEVKDEAEMTKVEEARQRHRRDAEEFERTRPAYSQRRMLPFIPNPYRSGGWWVMRDDAIRRIVTTPDVRDHVLRARWTFITRETAVAIGLRNPDGTLSELSKAAIPPEEETDGVRGGGDVVGPDQAPPAG